MRVHVVRTGTIVGNVPGMDWFGEDVAADRLLMLGVLYAKQAVDTSRRIAAFVRERPTVLVPTHDADAAKSLAGLEPLTI